jgi:hypothetical protein
MRESELWADVPRRDECGSGDFAHPNPGHPHVVVFQNSGHGDHRSANEYDTAGGEAMIKTITHPDTGKAFKLGRRRPVARCPRLSLRNYLLKSFPTAPPAIDYSAKPKAFLSEILGNDVLGDCTAAGAFHIGGMLLANASAQIPYTQADVIKFYSATTGYVPGDESTDQGGNEQDVLNWWRQYGLLGNGSHAITGWVAVNGNAAEEVRAALWLFENLYFGVELPDAWINPMPGASGFIWAMAGDPDPDNGHCFAGVGYDAGGVTIDTWGMSGTVTWDAVAKYAASAGQGELYAVLGQDAIDKATAKAPNGLDWSQLVADLDSLR